MIFDNAQQEVLGLSCGKHKVFAPPGSGKTELLSHRVLLAVESGVDSKEMACLTFTNRAARTMSERMPASCGEVFVGNFHAFGIRFLTKNGHFPIGGAVLDEEDAHLLVIDALDMALCALRPVKRDRLIKEWPRKDLIDFTKRYSRLKTQQRLHLMRPVIVESEQMLFGVSDSAQYIKWHHPLLFRLLEQADGQYIRLKQASLALDFDDILSLTAHHLYKPKQKNKGALFSWVQVDEAQDLNAIQWAILDLLTDEKTHLVILGDNQQSIFSFMGSSFKKLESETIQFQEHRLEINYRSPAYLLDFYKHYSNTILKEPIQITSRDRTRTKEGAMKLLWFDSDQQEKREISRKIVPMLIANHQESVAVLVRTNFIAQEFSLSLQDAGIKHFLVSQFDIFRTANTKDFMALLTVMNTPGNRIAWTRVLKVFGKLKSLKQSRRIVNELFESAVNPSDLLVKEGDVSTWPLAVLAQLIQRERVVIFDLETTGLDIDTVDIVQIAAIEILEGKVKRSLNLYLRTPQSLAETEKIHGITKEKLSKDGIQAGSALKTLVDFVGESVLVAHNLAFDWPVLNNNLKRAGLLPFSPKKERYCSLVAARALYPNAPKHTLESLLGFLKLKGVNSHDARDDVLATRQLVKRIAKDAKKKHRKARRAIDTHRKALLKFNQGIKPLLDRLDKLRDHKTSFGTVFEIFVRYLKEHYPGYEWQFEKQIQNKLIRHMDATSKAAPLETLLCHNLMRYHVYREPDLIMDDDMVVVSTVHRAKGLEFDTVIIPYAVENTYPFYYAVKSGCLEKLEEEARTFYVALTRARHRLIISEHKYYNGMGMPRRCQSTRFLRGLKFYFNRY